MDKPTIIHSTEEAEERLRSSAYPKTAPVSSFQESLQAQLHKKRLEKPAQPSVFSGIFWKAFVPAATVLTIAILFVIPNFLQKPDVQKETGETPTVQIEPIAPMKPTERKIRPPSAPPSVTKQKEPAVQPTEDDFNEEEAVGEATMESDEAAGEPAAATEAPAESAGAQEYLRLQNDTSSVAAPEPTIRLTRTYTDIDGDTNIQESETVIVTFSIVADSTLPAGAFEIIDYIPEGFTFDATRSPAASSIAGQTITFRIERSDQPFRYFVTAAKAGEYTVPPAQIRSLEHPEISIFSDQIIVKIQSL